MTNIFAAIGVFVITLIINVMVLAITSWVKDDGDYLVGGVLVCMIDSLAICILFTKCVLGLAF